MRQVVALVALLALLAWANAGESETDIRLRLGIPSGAKRVLILSQSSHMDWDWLETFPGYYSSKVNGILSSATEVLTKYKGLKQPYYYSVAETGFLQRFWTENPSALPYLRASGHRLHMVGGGITSPDSLLNHGEAFIRNFLVGQGALRNVSLPNITNIWVPDDFGHDGQLPVMVRAMGLGAAGFARVPGAMDQGPPAMRIDGLPSTAETLMQEGVSFTWAAKDGSTMFAHWLQAHYNQGDDIDDGTIGSDSNCDSYNSAFNIEITNSHIDGFVLQNGPTAVSPYMFVAIGDDFRPPKPCLLTYIDNWNLHVYGNASHANNDVYAVSATFDHYVGLVTSYASKPGNPSLRVRHFEPTPYWTGFYASRPQLKILQEIAVRNMIAAESLLWLTKSSRQFAPLMQTAWAKIAPSTHHDFVTGTAPDTTYYSEQLPYLNSAVELSSGVITSAMIKLSNSLTTDATDDEVGVVWFNPLGYRRPNGVLRLPRSWAPSGIISFWDGTAYQHIQREGDWIYAKTFAGASPQSYYLGKLTKTQANITGGVLRVRVNNQDDLILENALVRVHIQKSAGWAAVSIVDLTRNIELVKAPASPSDDPGAFTLQVLRDGGNIYRFANEMSGCEMGTVSEDLTPLELEWNNVLSGPVRIVIPTRLQAFVGGTTYNFVRTYVLYADEPFVRVEVTGTAPSGYSVFMRTPITFLQPMISYGTPYHWDTHVPAAYWQGYNFMAIHNFLTLTSLEGINIAFYSSMLRAWALDGTVVVTALFRNTPGGCIDYGAQGSDGDEHTVELAFRVPGTNLQPAPGLVPLVESLAMTTPMIAAVVNTRASFSSSNFIQMQADNAVITTLKSSESDSNKLILRLYSPIASETTPVTVTFVGAVRLGRVGSVIPLTALENPYHGDQRPPVKIVKVLDHGAIISMQAAIVTLLLVPQ